MGNTDYQPPPRQSAPDGDNGHKPASSSCSASNLRSGSAELLHCAALREQGPGVRGLAALVADLADAAVPGAWVELDETSFALWLCWADRIDADARTLLSTGASLREALYGARAELRRAA
jgi:hypothetical protein